jgi:predicted metal-dependent enzyme (double-stranded beta helix superfamily)
MARAARTLRSPMSAEQLPAFKSFIDDLRAIWQRETDTQKRMEAGKLRLEQLVRDPSLQDHSRSWPSTEGRKNLLLHEDAEHGFVVNAVVRVPGRTGSVHDHADAWTAYGVCDGAEYLERYERLDDASKPGYAEVVKVSTTLGTAGTVDLVAPYAIHAEQGGDGRSAAVILRSQRLVGRVLQHNYDPAKNVVTEQSGPTQIPYVLQA